MLQLDEAGDFVLGTGETHSVKEFVDEAFSYVGLQWKKYVEIDPRYFRPTEIEVLQADISKSSSVLGWQPKVTFKELVRIMVDADLELAGHIPVGDGKKIASDKVGWASWGQGEELVGGD